MNQTLKRKLIAISTSFVSFATILAICGTSILLIRKSYFSYIFVSGGSMNPTLRGGHDSHALAPHLDEYGNYVAGDIVNFGIVDNSTKAKKNIQRYDIVTTYFPDEDYDSSGALKKDADYKIKRVIALPGETFKIENGGLSVLIDDNFTEIERKHLIDDGGNPSCKDVSERTLKDGEYWVMGDHRNGSRDCVTFNAPVTFSNITGVLVSIEGTAEYFVHYNCSNCKKEVNDKDYIMGKITACEYCGGVIKRGKSDIRNREYTYPEII